MPSIKTLQENLQEAREQGDEKQIANMAYKLGDTYMEKGKLDKALPLLQEAYSLCEKEKDDNALSIVAFSLSSLYLVQEDAENAEKIVKPAYDYYKKIDNPQGLVKACLLLGDIKWAQNLHEQAIPFYDEAKEICRAGQDTVGLATFLDRIAKMYRFLENDQEARGHFEKSLLCWQVKPSRPLF